MTYQVLARKWRPKSFATLVGQEHVLQALVNALEQGRLHHAYLFTGTRGVGKTTIARILAKCLNCEKGVSSEPCGQCSACTAIDAGNFVDLIEVDAASRTKVEDTRDLLDNVQYAPAAGRYKVYLIDEVHMLSGHSFNALLKTLEEPPPHVKFLLATTDPQKLPITVLSRCLQFNLKNLLPELISSHLAYVLKEENIPFEVPALKELAQAADGSMRDALSLLDQAIAFGNGTVKTEQVHAMLGTIEQQHVLRILNALIMQDAPALLDIASHLTEQAVDFAQALEALLSSLHQIAVLQATGLTKESELANIAKQINKSDIQLFYQIALLGRKDLPLAPSAKIGFEMVLLRMLEFRPSGKVAKPKLENSAEVTAAPQEKKNEVKRPKPKVVEAKPIPPESIEQAAPEQDLADCDWNQLTKALPLKGMLVALANNCQLKQVDGNAITLLLSASHAPLLTSSQQQRLQKCISDYYTKPIKLIIETAEAAIETPATIAKAEDEARQQRAQESISNDPTVGALLESFNATVDNTSINAVNPEEK